MKKAKNNEKKLLITAEQNGFTIISNNICRNNILSDGAKSLYIYLKSHSETFNLSAHSIGAYLNKSYRTIQREIEELKENGFLIISKIENSNNYKYELSNSPKLEHLKDFSNENILNAFDNDIIDLKDILSLYRKKYITLKQYKEITNEIFRIAKTKWVKED